MAIKEAKIAIVVTSISSPNKVLTSIANGAIVNDWKFYVVGDQKSPDSFELDGCDFLGLETQGRGTRLSEILPTNHYCRKNLGYIDAIKSGAEVIVETDDDNFPLDAFWIDRAAQLSGRFTEKTGWVNAYSHFSDLKLWPRGFPLDQINVDTNSPSFAVRTNDEFHCPIQQGLANGDTDVDAIYRMVIGSDVEFRTEDPLVLGRSVWCPFNSQSTFWWKEAFQLLYLPSTCSFRMTDIWRSFVAQRCLWENDWNLAFISPVAYQERNQHNLMVDFESELKGYLRNDDIRQRFDNLKLERGPDFIAKNMHRCYETLIEMNLILPNELDLLEAWLSDIG